MQYYSMHIGDYTTATVHLTPLEDLTYRRLLDFYYMKEEPIPLDTHWVSRRLRVDTEDVENVLKEFFTETEDGWKNERCDEDIAKYHAMANRNKVNGSRGGRPKKNQNKPTGLRVGTESEPTGKPTINHKPLTINHSKEEKVKKEPSGAVLHDKVVKGIKWPDSFDGEMKELFEMFLDERRTNKKYITKNAVKGLFNKLEGFTRSEQMAAINDAITGGYQGLFPKVFHSSGPVQNTTRLPTTEELSKQEGVASNEDELQF